MVRLRAYEKSDLDAVMKWVNDEEVIVIREDYFARGKYHDTIKMGSLESEYRALP